MQQYKKILGKVMMTAEGTYNKDKKYEPISLVTDEETNKSYISRKEVPVGTQINNREYWQPVASSGIIDNGVIILNRKNSDGQVPIYDLKSAAEAVAVGDRKGGVILGFLGFNPETDTVPTWKLYQYNDVSPSNWTNIDYWLPMDYTNKYAGWFDNEEALYDSVPFPKIGMYAYVGNSASSALVYRCYNDRIWQPTEDKAFSGVVNLADEEDITSKQNKLKFKDKEYNPAQYNGLGRIYLRKNMIDGKNILTKEMIETTNTIYIIQYDYDLQGQTITIPEGCVLDFNGGSLNNGTLVFNNTTLLSKVNINCRFSGRIANESIHLEWFTGNDYDVIQDAINCINVYRPDTSLYVASVQEIKFKNGKVYTIDKELNFGHYLKIDGNEAIIKNTTVGGTIFKSTLAFYINVCNLNFIGTNVKAFHVPAPNYDDAKFRFKNLCIQTDNYDKSIENNYAFVLSSRSCHIILEQIDCQQAVQFLRCTADFVYLKDSWINGYSNKTNFVRPENTCSINNEGTSRMTIRNTVFIPEHDGQTPNRDTRWIDNYAHLSIQDSHFGGENAGYAIIWQYQSPDKLSELAMHHCQIDISNTQCAAGAYYKYWGGLVVLMKNVLPGKFCFKNTYPAAQTQLISLYGWVKDEDYSFTNYSEVYSKAAPLFCEYVNQHINNKTFLPSKSIYTENSISVDKCFRPFLGNNNINFNPSEFDKDLIFGILHRSGYDLSAYQWSEYKFRVGVSGYHNNGNTFCKYITYRFVVHQQAGANPRIFTYTEDSSISKTWEDMPDDLLTFSLKCTEVNTYSCDLSIKITKSSDISTNLLGVSIQPILIGATHSAVSALPSFYPIVYK